MTRIASQVGAGLVALLSFVALSAPSAARADTGLLGVGAGAMMLHEGGSTHFRPQIRAEASLRLAGPLYAGAFIQATGEDIPLSHPAIGGGLSAALRFDVPFLQMRPYLLGEAGRLNFATTQHGDVGTWDASVSVGVGFPILAGAALIDFRLGHTWLFDLPAAAQISSDAWTGQIGISLALP